MAINILNRDVKASLEDCERELANLSSIITTIGDNGKFGSIDPKIKYFTYYALIKAYGTIEVSYKSIIASYHNIKTPHLNYYFDKKIMNATSNATYDNICRAIGEFSNNWVTQFKNAMLSHPNYDKLVTSLKTLNNNRNNFAHGISNASLTFASVQNCFADAVIILEILEETINKTDL